MNPQMIEQLRKDHPKASDADLEQIANAQKASNTKAVLAGVPNANDIKFDDAIAERGKKIILDTVRKGAELTREIFSIIRACEGPDYVEGTFKVAEARAIKAIREGQPEGEKPIKNLSDIAKIQGGPGAGSYITVKNKLINAMKMADELTETLQQWYNFQAKHDGEPQAFVQPEFLNPWSKRYADEKRGWSTFSRDLRLAEQCALTLDQRKKALEKAKGKEAAAQTGQNGDQQNQGMASGSRQRGNLADSTQQCLNAVVKAVHDCADELPQEEVNGYLSVCAKSLQDALATKRAKVRADVAATSSKPSQGIAAAESGGTTESVETGKDADESSSESGASTEGESVVGTRPEWLRQEDWDVATEEERARMIDEGQKAYEEEDMLMGRGEEQKDAESNEPVGETEKPAESKEA